MTSIGRSYVYLLPLVWEDHCKLGFSRDPLSRIQAFHRRWFDFFDLDHGLLVEAETVRDARAIELQLRRALAEHNAPMPMTVREAAAGRTEWFRGATARLEDEARALEAGGHVLHAPLRPWMRHALEERTDRLYSWSEATWAAASAMGGAGRGSEAGLLAGMRDVLDAHVALGIALEALLPPDVWAWYGRSAGGEEPAGA